MKKSFKLGESVDKIPGIHPTKDGEERYEIIYKRKAIYKDDPYSPKRNK